MKAIAKNRKENEANFLENVVIMFLSYTIFAKMTHFITVYLDSL